MIKQNISIINNRALYKILDEIKENLPFNIIEYKYEDDHDKNNSLDISNTLFVSRTNKTFNLIKNLNEKKVYIFNIFPTPINKFIQIINIQLIKQKYNQQSKINIGDYELNLNSKILSKKKLNLKLTEKETEIIL